VNYKELAEKEKQYIKMSEEYDAACLNFRSFEPNAKKEITRSFDTLGENIQRFCGSENFRSIIKNFCYLYSGMLSISSGNLLFCGSVLPALPYDSGNAKSTAENCVLNIKRATQGLAQKSGSTEALLRALCQSYTTLRSIYANINDIAANAIQDAVSRERQRNAQLKKKLDSFVAENPIFENPGNVREIIEKMKAEAEQATEKFRFKNMAVSTDYGASVSIPFAMKTNKAGEDEVICWEPLRQGVLYIDCEGDSTDRPLGLVKGIVMQFLYSYPGADKQIFYCCKEASSIMDTFLANLENKDDGLGSEIFFRNVQQLESRDFRRSVADYAEYLREEAKERLVLLDDADKADVFEYNAANTKNIQKPLLVIMHEYPNGFDDCSDLDYLFKEGSRLGIFFLVIKTKPNSKQYSRYEDELADPAMYSKLSCVYGEGGFSANGSACTPISVKSDSIKELIKNVAKLKKASKKEILSYEDIGYGKNASNAEGAVISIPVAVQGNDIYNLDFGCSGSSPIAYLLVGAPGTGKSSLIDAMIINGAMQYSPDDLNFYLLDFKDGLSSSVYKDNPIPHVRVIAENNKEEEAGIILDSITKEKERRNLIFASQSTTVHNIEQYNRIHDVHMPRIIVVIDECQVLFENPELAKACENIARQGRSVGIHLLLASQSVTSGMMNYAGKFIDGRFCFEVDMEDAERIINRSDAARVRSEVPKGSGFAFASSDSGVHCSKIRIAWHDEKIDRYNKDIREKWFSRGYKINLSIVGKKTPLSIEEACTEENLLGAPELLEIPFGENYFNHAPETLDMSRESKNRSVLILGQDEKAAESLLASVMTGALRAGATVKLVDESEERWLHEFFGRHPNVDSKLSDEGYLEFLSDAYSELLRRRQNRREKHKPYFLILNCLQYFNAYIDDTLYNGSSEPAPTFEAPQDASGRFDLSAFRKPKVQKADGVQVNGRKTLLQIVREISNVNGMYVVISAPDSMEFGDYADKNILKGCDYKILQHDVKEGVRNLMEDSFRYKMINGINENMVLISNRQQYGKARFFQYDFSKPQTKQIILSAVNSQGK
jgi:SpoVK/Ycf46/Vps4 family AAA+-type ATPase